MHFLRLAGPYAALFAARFFAAVGGEILGVWREAGDALPFVRPSGLALDAHGTLHFAGADARAVFRLPLV